MTWIQILVKRNQEQVESNIENDKLKLKTMAIASYRTSIFSF